MSKPDYWFVYMLKCANGAFYTGIAKNVPSRVAAHNNGTGARYTRSFGPVKLVWQERRASKSLALKREALIKSWKKETKAGFVLKKTGDCFRIGRALRRRRVTPELTPNNTRIRI